MREEFEGSPEIVHHMGQAKWAEMAAWGMFDDETKKEFILRKLDQRIMRKEAKVQSLNYKINTLKMMKEAIKKR